MRRTALCASLAFLLVLLGILIWGTERKGHPPRTEANHSTQDESELRPTVALAPKDPLGRNPRENLEALYPGIVGSVTSDGVGIAGATVYAYALADRPEYTDTPIAEASTDTQGRFTLLVPRRPGTATYDVGAIFTGLRRQLQKDVVVAPDQSAVADFALDTGEWITGRVVDSSGAPVSGFEVFASSKPTIGLIGHRLLTTALMDTRALVRASRGSSYHESAAVTDTNGEFALKGLAAGTYAIVPRSYRWIANPGIKVDAPHRDVRVVVVRSRSIAATVVDAENGAPLPRFSVQVAMAGRPLTLSGGGLDGRIDLAWLPNSGESELEVEIRVQAEGYLALHKTVALSEAHCDLGSVPLNRAGVARLRIDVHFDDGTPLRERLWLEYGQSDGGQRGRTELRFTGPGAYEASLPAGHWFLRLRPDGALARSSRWRGEVTCEKNDTVWTQAALVRGGVLEVARPESPEGRWQLLVMGDAGATMVELPDAAMRFEHVTPGEWTLRLLHDGTAAGERVVEIRARDECSVEFR